MTKHYPTPAVEVVTTIFDGGYIPVLKHPSGSVVIDQTTAYLTPSVAARHGRYWAQLIEEILDAVGRLGIRYAEDAAPSVVPRHTCTLGRPERWCERCGIEDGSHELLTEVR